MALTTTQIMLQSRQGQGFFLLLFALLWYPGDLIKDQEPAMQGAAQTLIKSTLYPPVAISFLNGLVSL